MSLVPGFPASPPKYPYRLQLRSNTAGGLPLLPPSPAIPPPSLAGSNPLATLAGMNGALVIQNNPQSVARQYYEQGETWYQASNFKNAVTAFDAYLTLCPNDPKAYNKRGVAKAGLKDYSGAIADYTEAIRLKPDFAHAFLNRGNLWVYLGHYAEKVNDHRNAHRDFQLALNDYAECIRLHPLGPAAYENRAELCSDLGMRDQALRDKAVVIQLQKMKAPTTLGLPFCPPRIALVLANDDYVGTENDLRGGPMYDANAMAATLRSQGFYVMTGYNLNGPQMKDRVGQFINRLQQNPGAVSLIYYSGHGGSINGNNYLIPTEYTGAPNPDFETNSVSVDYLLKQLKQANSYFNMIFLDACRTPIMGNTAFRSAKAVMKQWETEPGPGLANTWIEYASRPKKPALQDGSQGLYTKYLLQYMKRPDLNLKEVSMYTSYALESDPVAAQENQHARTQTDLAHTEDIAQAFSFARHCVNHTPHVNPSA